MFTRIASMARPNVQQMGTRVSQGHTFRPTTHTTFSSLQRRDLSEAIAPTRFDVSSSETGHAELRLTRSEATRVRDRLPPGHELRAELTHLLESGESTIPFGHLPDTSRPLRREAILQSRESVSYENMEFPAASVFAKAAGMEGASVTHLGEATDAQIDKLVERALSRPRTYSLSGKQPVEERHMTPPEQAMYEDYGYSPDWGENCVDFHKDSLLALAKGSQASPQQLEDYKNQLSEAKRPQDFDTANHFGPDANGNVEFKG